MSFGLTLRQLRIARGWRQEDLAQALDGAVARSTIANVETGRESPTPRLWALLGTHVPEWSDDLRPAFDVERAKVNAVSTSESGTGTRSGAVVESADEAPLLGGPFVVERLDLVYNFEESRAPSEIVEVRTVRATRAGAAGYGLSLRLTESPNFTVDESALWGGYIIESRHDHLPDKTLYWRRFEFGRTLRREHRHDFAVRSWVETDPDPDTAVCLDFTIPAEEVNIHLNFNGSERPTDVWSYGPLHDVRLIPKTPSMGGPVGLSPGGTASAAFQPQSGPMYGVAWRRA